MQQAESIQKIPEFSFEKELARDHALSLCLCNLFIFFSISSQRREKPKKKKKKNNAWPQVRKERNLFFFLALLFSLTELDWNSVKIEEGWDKTKIQNGGRNGTLEVGQSFDKSDA